MSQLFSAANFKALAGKLALLTISLGALALVLEFVVFRYILVPDDVLENVTINGVVRYKPNSQATFRHPDGTTTRVTINADGWNSTKHSYSVNRALNPERTRVAVVGDSYVHGAFVNVEEGFPAILETHLNKRMGPTEVYRFGMDGAPLSQYLHVLRREVSVFKPDIVVIPLIHNDFDESFRFLHTRYASSFMKVRAKTDGSFEEVPASPFKPGVADLARKSATFRYLYYETNLYLHLKALISKYYWGGKEEFKPEFISSAVDIRNLKDDNALQIHTRYVLKQIQTHARNNGYKILFVMDGVREATYAGKSASTFDVGKLNKLAATLTGELGLPFIDLQTVFDAHYRKNAERFEFSYDWHWNKLGNKLVALSIADTLEQNPTWFRSNPRTVSGARAASLVRNPAVK